MRFNSYAPRLAGWIYSHHETHQCQPAVKRTISLPKDLADEVEQIARAERRSLSSVIQEALRTARNECLKREFKDIQGYWSRKAREKGIVTERDLKRYLRD
ncbi:ribbon-helix-helix protein, CopG family [Candidatus Binatus sp.]|uniref:ribbon-helix-helix protein, CopG family n=1 Tax=Candidatus Binatus sp. TaxID=2811406 RepID=UPI00351D5E91